jgi:hypothetical protein
VATHAKRDVAPLDLVEQAIEAFDDRPRVHHVTVDYRLSGERVVAEPDECAVSFTVFFDFAELDRARAYVNAD